MAGITLSELTEVLSANKADILPIIINVGGGTLGTRKISIANLLKNLSNYYLKALDTENALGIADGLVLGFITDNMDGVTFSKLSAGITGTVSSSGNVVIRIYNVTKARTVSTVTITAGNRVGTTTSFENPTVSAGDLLRIDCTNAGTGVKGLDVWLRF